MNQSIVNITDGITKAAIRVIQIPAFAMSATLKYPHEYGMTFTGVDVTNINARERVIIDGITIERTDRLKLCAVTIIIGITTVAVTVLLERPNLRIDITIMIMKHLQNGCAEAIPPSNSWASQFAAPVLYNSIPKVIPVAISNNPLQEIFWDMDSQLIEETPGRNKMHGPIIAGKEVGIFIPKSELNGAEISQRNTVLPKASKALFSSFDIGGYFLNSWIISAFDLDNSLISS